MPTYRQHMRSEIFSLRDELRNLYLSGEVREDQFKLVHGKLNFHLTTLGELEITEVYYFAKAYKNNRKFRKQVENRMRRISEIKDDRLINIINNSTKNLEKVTLLNSAWLIFPLLPFLYATHKIITIKKYIERVAATGSNSNFRNNKISRLDLHPG